MTNQKIPDGGSSWFLKTFSAQITLNFKFRLGPLHRSLENISFSLRLSAEGASVDIVSFHRLAKYTTLDIRI